MAKSINGIEHLTTILYYSLDLFNSHLFSAFCCIQDQLRNLIWMRQKWSVDGEWWVIRSFFIIDYCVVFNYNNTMSALPCIIPSAAL